MKTYEATEQAYKNGYSAGYKAGRRSVGRKSGRWIDKKLDDFRKWELRCSECDWVGISNYDAYDEPYDFNYCPNCGAKMEGEEE